jgi:hypothetical protein
MSRVCTRNRQIEYPKQWDTLSIFVEVEIQHQLCVSLTFINITTSKRQGRLINCPNFDTLFAEFEHIITNESSCVKQMLKMTPV